MAFPAENPSNESNELHEKLKWSFSCAIEKSEFLKQSKDFKAIEGWYSQTKKTSDIISNPSIVSDGMIKELLHHVYPHYTNIVLEKTDINIKSTDEGVQTDIDLGIVTMNPYVEFVMIVDRHPTTRSKFTFQLDMSTYVSILNTINNSENEYIVLKKLGIELEMSLLKMPYLYLSEPIKLTTKAFEISNLRLLRKRQ
jgi:hypothetical protein